MNVDDSGEGMPSEGDDRRDFLKKASLGGLSLGAMEFSSVEEEVDYTTQNVNRHSRPSNLEITDLRIAQVGNVPIVRIDTNQDIHGLGDVRDAADPRYALMLKSRLLGKNPTNVEKLFKMVKQFGGHGRQGGGVSGVEVALWDLAGKAYGVPVYQLLGGKYRDEVRIYVDTPTVPSPQKFARRMQGRVDQGFTFLKMDVGIGLIDEQQGTLTGADVWKGEDGELHGWNDEPGTYGSTQHPFTRIQITEKGLDQLAEYFAAVREQVGYEIPIGVDHLGHFGVNSAIRFGRRMEEYNLAFLEDVVPWMHTDMMEEISRNITIPMNTGEDIYLLDGFKELIDRRAVDLVHPDPLSAGGLMETKRIGDYAEQRGVAMALHHASSPVSFMGTIHAAAATQNFVALEHHSVDNAWWEDLVTGVEKPIVENGYVTVPEKPGIGVELNEEVVKKHLAEGAGYFEPTPEWNEKQSWDRTWS
ncbi:MAG: mandelate racemase/muconate lactonizing enzyme family protein [Salinibacter sp.]